MKLIPILAATCLTLISLTSHAGGKEELCSNIAMTNIRIKDNLNESKNYLPEMLKKIKTSNEDKEFQATARERLFFVNNRKNLSDEDLRTISLMHCMAELMN